MEFDLGQNILRHLHENGALAEQAICAPAFARINRPGDRKHIAVLVEGKLGGDQRAAFATGLNDDRAQTQAADDAVAPGKVMRLWGRAQGKFG